MIFSRGLLVLFGALSLVACVSPSDEESQDATQSSLSGRLRIFPRSDSCNGEFIPVDWHTDCYALQGSAWSVLVDGQCSNIADTTAVNACRQYAQGLPRGPRLFPRSDSCTGEFIPVGQSTDCNALSGTTWSILDQGQCWNIVDTSAVTACR